MSAPRTESSQAGAGGQWYRQSILWLGIAVFIASLAGCIWIITVSARHADVPLETSHTVFGVPASARSSHRADAP